MSRNANPVPAVLFPDAEQGVLAAGNGVEDLALGQVGVFDADTNESVDASADPMPRRFYIAVGIDADGDGVVDDIARSGGQAIQRGNVISYESHCYNGCVPQVIHLDDIEVKCERDYIIKLGLIDAEAFINYGYRPVNKSFVVRTDCCNPCDEDECNEADCRAFAVSLKEAINADPEALFTVELFNPASAGLEDTALTDEEALALVDGEGNTVCPVVRITSNCGSIKDFCGIPFNQTFPRGTAFEVSFADWDCAIPSTETIQDLAYEEYAGYDAKTQEFWAQGVEVGPYRITESGVQSAGPYKADVNTNYNVINLNYDVEGHGGFEYYKNAVDTTIFFECGVNTASNGLALVLDAILAAPSMPLKPQAALLNACDCGEEGENGENGESGESGEGGEG